MKNLSINQKLGIGFSVILGIAAVISGIGLWRLHASAESTRQMLNIPLKKERLVSDWYATVNAGVRRTAAIARSSDPSLVSFFASDVSEASKASSGFQKGFEDLLDSDEEKKLFAQVGEYRKAFISARDKISELKKAGQEQAAIDLLETSFKPVATSYLNGMLALQAMQRQGIDQRASQLEKLNQRSSMLMLSLSIIAILSGGWIAWMISRLIITPLHQAVAMARQVASGDLTGRLGEVNSDETGILLSTLSSMRSDLVTVVSKVRENSERIAHASAEIADGNLDLSRRTESQAASLEQTSATMSDLNDNVRQNANNAQQSRQLAEQASQVAANGGAVVGKVVSTMDDINASSREINDIISVIDGIAFQTNILALNAAVEAARAGEQGRGFAVVASEVRTLAQRSAQAAKEIKSLITVSVQKVEAGTRLVAEARSTMDSIVDAIQKVSVIVSDISVASADQSQGVDQVGHAVQHMDEVTQQNAALVEQSAAAAESLKIQAAELVDAVAVFQLPR